MGFNNYPSVNAEKIIQEILEEKYYSGFARENTEIPKRETIDQSIINNDLKFLFSTIHKCKIWTNEEEFNNYQRIVIGINFLKQINSDEQN